MTKLENLSYDGNGKMEKIACPLCGGWDFRPVVVEQGIPVVRCYGCKLVFANPRPDPAGLKAFYQDYFPSESEEMWQEQMADVFFREGLQAIRRYEKSGVLQATSGPRLLDIGCGMGFFMDLMRHEGWEVFGVEPAADAVRHATYKLGLNVIEGTLEESHFAKPFDVVTLWYVMEHVPNPGEILSRVAELLKPGGLAIIRVPNQSAPMDRILAALKLSKYFLMNPPRHLFDYSPKTIRRFLETRGMEVLAIQNGIPRSTGTWLELVRRYVWYGMAELLYHLSGGRIIRGSSMTVYSRKNV